MFYDFTDVCLVNVNNALELANQSKYYIAIWYNKSFMYVHDVFMTENNRAMFSSFINILICLSLAVTMSQGP